MGLYRNSALINSECKIEILVVYFLVFCPIALITSLFLRLTFVMKGYKCSWFMNWPSKFFYSGTNMLLYLFFQPLLVASLQELYVKDFSSSYSVLSYSVSVFIVIACGLFYFSTILVNLWNIGKARHPMIRKMFLSYISPMRKSWIAYWFWPIYLTKYFIMSFIYSFADNAYVQIFAIIIMSIIMIIGVMVTWPFANFIVGLFFVLCELVIIGYFVC